MNGLFVLYSALAVFGIGVTIVDLFGVFEHAGQSAGSHEGSHDSDSGSAHDDGSSGDHDSGSSDSDHDGSGVHDDGAHGDHMPAHQVHVGTPEHHDGEHGSNISSADSGTRFVARTIGALRTGGYFSLGAETEVCVRAKDSARTFPKGCMVRIVDFDDECCWVDVL